MAPKKNNDSNASNAVASGSGRRKKQATEPESEEEEFVLNRQEVAPIKPKEVVDARTAHLDKVIRDACAGFAQMDVLALVDGGRLVFQTWNDRQLKEAEGAKLIASMKVHGIRRFARETMIPVVLPTSMMNIVPVSDERLGDKLPVLRVGENELVKAASGQHRVYALKKIHQKLEDEQKRLSALLDKLYKTKLKTTLTQIQVNSVTEELSKVNGELHENFGMWGVIVYREGETSLFLSLWVVWWRISTESDVRAHQCEDDTSQKCVHVSRARTSIENDTRGVVEARDPSPPPHIVSTRCARDACDVIRETRKVLCEVGMDAAVRLSENKQLYEYAENEEDRMVRSVRQLIVAKETSEEAFETAYSAMVADSRAVNSKMSRVFGSKMTVVMLMCLLSMGSHFRQMQEMSLTWMENHVKTIIGMLSMWVQESFDFMRLLNSPDDFPCHTEVEALFKAARHPPSYPGVAEADASFARLGRQLMSARKGSVDVFKTLLDRVDDIFFDDVTDTFSLGTRKDLLDAYYYNVKDMLLDTWSTHLSDPSSPQYEKYSRIIARIDVAAWSCRPITPPKSLPPLLTRGSFLSAAAVLKEYSLPLAEVSRWFDPLVDYARGLVRDQLMADYTETMFKHIYDNPHLADPDETAKEVYHILWMDRETNLQMLHVLLIENGTVERTQRRQALDMVSQGSNTFSRDVETLLKAVRKDLNREAVRARTDLNSVRGFKELKGSLWKVRSSNLKSLTRDVKTMLQALLYEMDTVKGYRQKLMNVMVANLRTKIYDAITAGEVGDSVPSGSGDVEVQKHFAWWDNVKVPNRPAPLPRWLKTVGEQRWILRDRLDHYTTGEEQRKAIQAIVSTVEKSPLALLGSSPGIVASEVHDVVSQLIHVLEINVQRKRFFEANDPAKVMYDPETTWHHTDYTRAEMLVHPSTMDLEEEIPAGTDDQESEAQESSEDDDEDQRGKGKGKGKQPSKRTGSGKATEKRASQPKGKGAATASEASQRYGKGSQRAMEEEQSEPESTPKPKPKPKPRRQPQSQAQPERPPAPAQAPTSVTEPPLTPVPTPRPKPRRKMLPKTPAVEEELSDHHDSDLTSPPASPRASATSSVPAPFLAAGQDGGEHIGDVGDPFDSDAPPCDQPEAVQQQDAATQAELELRAATIRLLFGPLPVFPSENVATASAISAPTSPHPSSPTSDLRKRPHPDGQSPTGDSPKPKRLKDAARHPQSPTVAHDHDDDDDRDMED
ncbi:hypothetical protein BV22DRAFT_1132734 [Leucogyrophana mollusca]|uniref:Uncharacterized protein n=1 Tax=Leucogyrophana mollusca TaxID=85980 RepID=A0ACB8B5C9_9AGAM|nr:hypothetical protein BV22DRAFT_1132734 [Leucogyrophana mollusca]